jgi:hypothetical protein
MDFWASSGYRLLERGAEGLVVTEAWLARFLEREELRPPQDAGSREKALHARVVADPLAPVDTEEVAGLEDEDARENWRAFLAFRDRLLAHPTIEAAYVALFQREVDVAPLFIDALAQVIARAALDGVQDPYVLRAGELFFRRQRVSTEGGQVLAADATTLEAYAESGGFGAVGKLLREQLPAPKMDVLTRENAPFYFMRDELHSFALDVTPGREGALALARALERWIAHLLGVRVAIEPVERIDDARWRWHVGLDVESTAILNALYRGEAPGDEDLRRLVLLLRLAFEDGADALEEMRGRFVYLGVGVRPDRTLKLKPQNLVANLPLAPRS